jgi:hypothetical protein
MSRSPYRHPATLEWCCFAVCRRCNLHFSPSLCQVLENDATTNVVSIAQVIPGSPADGFAAQVQPPPSPRRGVMRHYSHTVQGDIIYEVDNFVVFRQPFNLWASVFNGSCCPITLTPLLPSRSMRRHSRLLHSHHVAEAQHQSMRFLRARQSHRQSHSHRYWPTSRSCGPATVHLRPLPPGALKPPPSYTCPARALLLQPHSVLLPNQMQLLTPHRVLGPIYLTTAAAAVRSCAVDKQKKLPRARAV